VNLTPAALLIVAVAVLLGVVGQWSDAFASFPWWRLVLAVLAAGLAYEFLTTRRARVELEIDGTDRLYLGRLEPLALVFTTPRRRGLEIEFAPTLPEALEAAAVTQSLRIPPGAAARAELKARPVALGVHAWPDLPLRIRGPLGLAAWSRRLPVAAQARVLPDTLGAGKRHGGSTELGGSTQSALGGARELHSLRDYSPGDPLNTIDWKATSRVSRLITRVFSEDQHLEVMIALDAGRTSRTEIDGMSQLGHYANLASRLAEYCITSDDQVGLVVFADRVGVSLKPGRGTGAVTRIRNALAQTRSSAVDSDVLNAALHVSRLVRHRCLVVVLTDIYERSATSQLVQTAKLLAPKHLPLIVGLTSEGVVDLAARPARHWLDPYRSFAAREFRRDVAANVARLARLGAYALAARPHELDRRVLDNYALLRAQRRI